MELKFKEIVEKYQCIGCVHGSNVSCFETNNNGGVGCGKHYAGTIISVIGSVLLGMPKGFNRLGKYDNLIPVVYETFKSSEWKYNVWNIPVWKYLSPDGHTFVRGIMPRKNEPFLHIFLENCIEEITCHEITEDDVNFMD